VSTIKLRRGTTAQWTAANPVLAAGEAGVATDSNRFKIGDGTARWAELPYFVNVSEVSDLVESALALEGGGVDGLLAQRVAQAFPAIATDLPEVNVAGPGGPSPLGTGVGYAFDDVTAIRRVGCVGETVTAAGASFVQNQVSTETGLRARPWAVEFTTDAEDMAIAFRAASDTPRLWVWVDGRPMSRGPRTFSTGVAEDNRSWLRLTFPDARRRTIRVYLARADYGGLSVAAGRTAVATKAVEPLKVALVGDSWFTDNGSVVWPYDTGAPLGFLLGAETFLCGIGLTGYVAAGFSTPYGSPARMAMLARTGADLVVVNGSTNDTGRSASAVTSAARDLYAAIADRLPAARVVVVGPQPVPAGYATSSQVLANRDAVKSAALAAPNVLGFVDPVARQWLTGSGRIDAPAGDGNRDYYVDSSALHLGRSGGQYYAQRILRELVRLGERDDVFY